MSGKVKIGVFGAYRGMTMISVLLKRPEAELVAICDNDAPALQRAGKAAEEAGLSIALYENFEDFFRHDMDAVVLANYANEHAPFAIRCLKEGKHVFSEVLPAQTMKEAVELVVYAFNHANAGDIMVQKAPACTIEVLAKAVKELFNAADHHIRDGDRDAGARDK